jgi:hypothetical protein
MPIAQTKTGRAGSPLNIPKPFPQSDTWTDDRPGVTSPSVDRLPRASDLTPLQRRVLASFAHQHGVTVRLVFKVGEGRKMARLLNFLVEI